MNHVKSLSLFHRICAWKKGKWSHFTALWDLCFRCLSRINHSSCHSRDMLFLLCHEKVTLLFNIVCRSLSFFLERWFLQCLCLVVLALNEKQPDGSLSEVKVSAFCLNFPQAALRCKWSTLERRREGIIEGQNNEARYIGCRGKIVESQKRIERGGLCLSRLGGARGELRTNNTERQKAALSLRD